MNKNLHRIVFNAARGMRMVVQESARSAGKSTTTTAGALGVALSALLGAAPAPAQIVGAPNVPGSQRPTVIAAPNGVPLVNIQTPSAAGVSRNVYSRFDVQSNGAILNNSRTDVQTQLGGWVQGNPWLATGPARIIVNEINSGNPSELRGYVEVAGQRAEVIIANPAGISVDGGGFINASRATLTTGVPQLNALGGLDGYRVDGGTIRIDGKGLDLSQTDYAGIYARALEVNAGIWANELKVVTGTNQIGAEPGAVTPIAGSGPAPAFALDVAALGGMYASKITLVGTEAGLGVRNAGSIGAGAGGLVVTAAGRLETTGTLQADTQLRIDAPGIANSGTIAAGSDLQIASSAGDIANSGLIQAPHLDLASSGQIDNRGGTIRQTGSASLTVTGPTLSNTAGGTIGPAPAPVADDSGSGAGGTSPADGGQPASTSGAGDGGASNTASPSTAAASPGTTPAPEPAAPPAPGSLSAATAILNDGGHIEAGGTLNLATPQINNAGGRIAVSDLAVSGPGFSNAGGTLSIANTFSANVGAFDNSGGALRAGSLNIASTGDLLNQNGSLSSDSGATLGAGGTLDNTGGAISATGALNASAAGALVNNAGQLVANAGVSLSARSLDNSAGIIASVQGGVQLRAADALTNTQGQIHAATDLQVQATSLGNAQGQLRAGQDATIELTGALVNDGTLTAGRHATLTAGSLAGSGLLGAGIAADGSMGSAGDLRVDTTGLLAAHGQNFAAGHATLQGGSVDLSGSATSAANLAITATQGDLDTRGATVATPGALTLRADANDTQTLVNQGGTLSAAALDVRSANLDNSGGGQMLHTGTDATIVAVTGRLANDGGLIASNGNTTLQAGTLSNRGGTVRAVSGASLALDVAGLLDNSGGHLYAAGAMTAAAAAFTNTGGAALGGDAITIDTHGGRFTNTGGQVQALGDLGIQAGPIDNAQGRLISVGGNTTLTSGGTLDNTGGLISAASTLTLQDPNRGNPAAKTLSIVNTGGTLAGGTAADAANAAPASGGIAIDAARYQFGDGTLASANDLTLALAQDIANSGSLSAGGDLSLSTTGRIDNTGQLKAGGSLSLSANAIDNAASGELSGTDTHLVAGSVTNRGLIDSNGETRIDAAGSVANLGTGRIYGDHVAIGTGTLTNDTDGGGQAGTIASRGDLDIGATQIDNRNGALIHSEGDLFVGGALDANGFATGSAAQLNNHSADIESMGNMELAVANVDNRDTHLQVVPGANVEHSTTTETTFYLGNLGYWTYDTTVTTDGVANTRAALISAGGDLTITGNLVNRDSRVVAGYDLAIHGSVDNGATQGQQVTSVHTTVFGIDPGGNTALFDYGTVNTSQGVDLTAYGPPQGQQAAGAIGGRPAVASTGGASAGGGVIIEVPSAAGPVTAADASGNASASQAVPMVVRTAAPAAQLPTASLFKTHPESTSRYLIETDPRFASYGNWLSSDYLLGSLGLDPDTTLKRLGDGFYEQRLIREQVAQLTGNRYLDGFQSDEAQYGALMEAGATFAKEYGLVPGIALTAEQMAQLTSDVVWLVTQTVTLPDGSTQQVLVPQVYVRMQPGDIDGHGALLSGDRVVIDTEPGQGTVTNSGTIAGRSLVSITADDIRNVEGGRISGGSVALDARNDLDNIGATIDARQAMSLSAGHDMTIASTTSATTLNGVVNGQVVDRVAGVYVSDPGGMLTINAGHDLDIMGAQIANRGAGGVTTLHADNDINLGTVTESSSFSYTTPNGKGFVANSRSDELGSTVSTNGATFITAGQDINARQAEVTAGDGLLAVNAGRNLNIVDGQSTRSEAFAFEKSETGTFTKSTVSVGASSESSTSVGSAFSGGLVSLAGGNNVNIVGSSVSGTDGVAIIAGNQLNIVEGRNTTASSAYFHRSTGGPMKDPFLTQDSANGNGIDTRTDNAAASTVTSAQGGVLLEGGNNVFLSGVRVDAAQDITIQGGDVTIVAARNESGLTLSEDHEGGRVSFFKPHAPTHGFGGQSEDAYDAQASTLTRTELQGANISITATGTDGSGGAIAIAGANINTPGTLKLEGDSVNLALQSTDLTMTQKGQGSDLMWQRTADSGSSDETLNYNQVNAGQLQVNANQVTVGMNAKDSVEALAQQPGMGWVQQISSDPNLQGKIDWERIEAAHKTWNYGQTGLTPEGAAIITVVVAYFTAGAAAGAGEAAGSTLGAANTVTMADGALFVGQGLSTSGAVIAGATTAGVSVLAGQAAVALINNQGDIGAALEDLGSSANVKNLLTAIVTGGVLGGLSMNPTGLPTTGGGAQGLMNQLGNNLVAGAAKAVVSAAINGGSLEDALKSGLLNAILDTVAAQTANAIGDLKLDEVTNKIAHAIAGCAVGAARENGSCEAGALGAAIGEMAAEVYGRDIDTVQFASMMSSIAMAIAGGDASQIQLAGQAGANAAANNYLNHDQWKKLAEDYAKCQSKIGGCTSSEAAELRAKYQKISDDQDRVLLSACSVGSAQCTNLLKAALEGAATQKDLVLSGALPDYYWAGSDFNATAKLLNSPQFRGATSEQAAEMAVKLGGIILDFTPGISDIKAFLEAETPFDYTLAAIGVLGPVGDLAAKLIKEAKIAAEAGDAVKALDKLTEAEAATKSVSSLGQQQGRFEDLARQFNDKSISPADMTLSVNGKKLAADPIASRGAPVFVGATDEEVALIFREMAGVSEMPPPSSSALAQGKTIFSVKITEGPYAGSTITMRNYSTSTAKTDARWTIDIKGNPANLRGNPAEIKFK